MELSRGDLDRLTTAVYATTDELALAFHVHRATVNRWARERGIRRVQIGERSYVTVPDLLESMGIGPDGKPADGRAPSAWPLRGEGLRVVR